MDSSAVVEYENRTPICEVKIRDKKLSFVVQNGMTLMRATTVLTKEPETIEWIDTFDSDDVLIDIGANVGVYTIYAAKIRGVKVFAFEPEFSNFALLNRNISLNDLNRTVTAYCVGIADCEKFDVIYLSAMTGGGSGHMVGDSVNFRMEPCEHAYKQGCFATYIDRLVADKVIPDPQHIKIDVDGIEHKIIEGACQTLRSDSLKSVLVEINQNLSEHMGIVYFMLSAGFHYDRDQAEKSVKKEGWNKGMGNYVFRRK